MIIPRLAFNRLVREIVQDIVTYNRSSFPTVDVTIERVTNSAFEALQYATESYISSCLSSANLIAMNAKRQTLMARDMVTYRHVQAMEQFVGPHADLVGGKAYKEKFQSVKGCKSD